MKSSRILLLSAVAALAATASAQTSPRLRQLPKNPPKEMLRATLVGPKSSSDLLHLSVSLQIGDPVGMQTFVNSVSDPKNPNYRHFISPDEVGRRFGMPLSKVQKISAYLKGAGMKVRLIGKNRLTILADATVSQVQATFHTSIQQFAIAPTEKEDDGRRFSFTSPPSLPSEIGFDVLDIGGLESFTRPKHMNLKPTQLQALYSVSPLNSNGMHGQGRTIGISNFDGFRVLNEIEECQQFGLLAPASGAGSNVSIVSVSGGTGSSAYEYGEGDLDIQAAIGLAPLCNLIVYDNGVTGFSSYDPIGVLTQEANDDAADLITESYGWQFDTATALAAHNLHLSMSAEGITYLAASGDTGTSYNGTYYPQIDPEVLTVGGTSVSVDANNRRVSEIGWNTPTGAGGGGWVPTSDAFNVRPPYQLSSTFLAGPGVPSPTNVPYRLIPDVSLDADPDTGYFIWIDSTEYTIGGTSGASPSTAAALGICEEQLISDGFLLPDSNGNYRLGRINDLIYAYNGDPTVFFDVTTGENGPLPNGQDSVAGPGWDTDTGWGPIIFSGLVARFESAPAVSSLTIAPVSVLGGTLSTGTVSISKAATADAVVTLSSSGPDVQVPSAVVIPAGSTSATFSIATSPVRSIESLSVVTTSGGSQLTASITVQPPALAGIVISPSSVAGGTTATGTLTLTGNAPPGGVSLALSTNNPIAQPPATVTIAAGSRTATFIIQTNGASSATLATLTANLADISKSATLTILPPGLLSVSLSPTTVVGASTTSVLATITLTGPAGSPGTSVKLTSSNTSVASVQSINTITAGDTSQVFVVTTFPVTSTQTVTITATLAGASQSALLTVNPFTLSAVTLSPANVLGGDTSTGIVTISQVPSVNVSVTVKSSSQNITVPSVVNISAGSQSATFVASTTGVGATTSGTVTCTLGASSKSAQLTVQPATVQSISVTPSTLTGGTTATGSVTLKGFVPAGGDVVTLFSSNISVATVPLSVTVSGTPGTASFTVSTLSVNSPQTATITAYFNGTSQTATVTVNPNPVVGLSVNPTSVGGGTGAFATVTLSQAAGSGGAIVNVLSSSSDASVPATVTIPSGSVANTFLISTRGVTKSETLAITAVIGNSRKSANLTLLPATLGSIVVSPNPILGGQTCMGTVRLTGIVATGSLVVKLASSSSNVKIPKSVTIAAGAGTATFDVVTSGVSSTQTVKLTATMTEEASQTTTLTVNASSFEDFSVSAPVVIGRSNVVVTGTITFNGQAGPGGDVVSLSSSNPKATTMPPTVFVRSGTSSVSFKVNHLLVSEPEFLTLRATYKGVSQVLLFTVNPFEIASLNLSPTSVVGGATANGTITLNAIPSSQGAVSVKLSSSSKFAKVPTQISVAAGTSSAKFKVTTSAVTTGSSSTITGTLNGAEKNSVLTINPKSTG